MMKRLWNDEVGAVVSAELVLVLTILVIGMIVGLAAVRDAVVTELADVAQAIANIDQTYSYPSIAGHHSFTGGGIFVDLQDFCDGAAAAGGQNSKCVTIGCAPSSERTGS
jgi:Flp pilus assembly pilin Flp